MIEERIKALVEKRTIEAARKELTSKLHVIVKAFGRPVVEQTVQYSMLPDFWEMDTPDILDDGDGEVYLKGYYFDGLRRGINLCIKLMFYDSRPAELIVHYQGYRTYMEIEGELRSYVPGTEWEDAVDRLYGYARPVEARKSLEEKEERKVDERKKAQGIVQRFKALWGY
jgi:hypothetical protein